MQLVPLMQRSKCIEASTKDVADLLVRQANFSDLRRNRRIHQLGDDPTMRLVVIVDPDQSVMLDSSEAEHFVPDCVVLQLIGTESAIQLHYRHEAPQLTVPGPIYRQTIALPERFKKFVPIAANSHDEIGKPNPQKCFSCEGTRGWRLDLTFAYQMVGLGGHGTSLQFSILLAGNVKHLMSQRRVTA